MTRIATEPGSDAHVTPPKLPERHRADRGLRLALVALNLGPVVILLLIVALMGVLSPFFLTGRNISNLVVQSSVVCILGMGALFVLLAGGIDISIGSMVAVSSVVGAILFNREGSPGLVVVTAMLAATAGIGFVNGFVYVKGRLPHPFIVTLGMLSIARGVAFVLADGRPIPGVPPVVTTLGAGEVGVIPVPAIVVVVLALVTLLLLHQTRWGQWIYAIGGNVEAARRTGIPVNHVLISTYAVGGIFAGIAGVVFSGRIAAGSPLGGQLLELDAIAAVVIGGASFLGGRGHVGHVLVGALTIGVIRNGMNLLDVDPYYQLIVLGTVLVLAVYLDTQRSRIVARLRVARSLQSGAAL